MSFRGKYTTLSRGEREFLWLAFMWLTLETLVFATLWQLTRLP